MKHEENECRGSKVKELNEKDEKRMTAKERLGVNCRARWKWLRVKNKKHGKQKERKEKMRK